MASEQFSLCWDNFHKNMSSGMHSLLESEDLVDVTLAVEGKFLKAHKMVLSVCSPYFRNLFRSTPCKHPIVFMKDVNYSAMCDLLQFMYQGEVQVNQENLTTFIKTAEALQIKGLTGDGNAAENDMENHHAELKTDPSPMKKPEQEPKPAVKVTRPKRPSGPALKRPKLSTSTIETPEKSNKVEATVTSTPEHIQFKMEPYESGDHSNAQVDDTAEDVYAEEALDDSQAEETEDYTLMEGNDEEPPQAGTSGDGTGEGQANKARMFTSDTRIIVDGFLYLTNSTKRKSKMRYLMCSEHRNLLCTARAAIPIGGTKENFVLRSGHNHPPSDYAEEKYTFMQELKTCIDKCPNVNVHELYGIYKELYPQASALYPYEKIRHKLRRWRSEADNRPEKCPPSKLRL